MRSRSSRRWCRKGSHAARFCHVIYRGFTTGPPQSNGGVCLLSNRICSICRALSQRSTRGPPTAQRSGACPCPSQIPPEQFHTTEKRQENGAKQKGCLKPSGRRRRGRASGTVRLRKMELIIESFHVASA
ncbi:hypothetical protein AGIG_G4371 [Arapaima gigas]